MPRTVAQILEETDWADVLGARVTYRVLWREQFSEEDAAHVRALDGRAYYLFALPKMVTAWDLVDGAGQPIPVTAEAIDANGVPTGFLRLVDAAIGERERLGKANSSSSSAG